MICGRHQFTTRKDLKTMTRREVKRRGHAEGRNAAIHGESPPPDVYPFERDYWAAWGRGYHEALAERPQRG